MSTSAISFVLDGEVIELTDVDPTRTVLQFLREDLRRKGTKEGCAEGDCGACTVVLAEISRDGDDLALRAVAAAEGLESTDDELNDELQQVADQFDRDIENVRDEFERAGSLSAVRSDIGKNKALEWILERVTVVDEDTEDKLTYQLVGELEADVKAGRLAITAPLARALIGKTVGDSVDVSTPKGEKSYEILKVKF